MNALPDDLFSSLRSVSTLLLSENDNFNGGLPSTIGQSSLRSLCVLCTPQVLIDNRLNSWQGNYPAFNDAPRGYPVKLNPTKDVTTFVSKRCHTKYNILTQKKGPSPQLGSQRLSLIRFHPSPWLSCTSTTTIYNLHCLLLSRHHFRS